VLLRVVSRERMIVVGGKTGRSLRLAEVVLEMPWYSILGDEVRNMRDDTECRKIGGENDTFQDCNGFRHGSVMALWLRSGIE
jgi:hypothetical protein